MTSPSPSRYFFAITFVMSPCVCCGVVCLALSSSRLSLVASRSSSGIFVLGRGYLEGGAGPKGPRASDRSFKCRSAIKLDDSTLKLLFLTQKCTSRAQEHAKTPPKPTKGPGVGLRCSGGFLKNAKSRERRERRQRRRRRRRAQRRRRGRQSRPARKHAKRTHTRTPDTTKGPGVGLLCFGVLWGLLNNAKSRERREPRQRRRRRRQAQRRRLRHRDQRDRQAKAANHDTPRPRTLTT